MTNALVEIVPEEVAVALAAGVTLEGEKEQVEAAGAPEQARVTAEAKLLREVTVTVKEAGLPAVTVACEGVSVSEKSGGPGVTPVPVSATC